MDDTPACYNCGTPLHGPFCAACGQEALPLTPSLRDVVRDTARELLDVDGRTVRSVQALFLAPGRLTREQFAGRRVSWLSPLKLYLTFSVIYFAVTALAGTTGTVRVNGNPNVALQRLGFQSEADLRLAIGRAQATWMPRVMFVLVPVFAGLVALVRRRSGRTYPQHLQFALHAHAAWFGARTLEAAAPLAPVAWLTPVVQFLVMIYGVAYVIIALRVAYGGTRRQAFLHAAIVLAIYGTLVVTATVAIVLPIFLPLMRGTP